MKALKSPLAREMLRAGIRIRPGVPIIWKGKIYVPTVVPKP